jgi:cytochrome b pre-mRNA-processing protein 3
MALLQRVQRFFSGPGADPAIAELYRCCVAQARQPAFYETLGVPDTVDGRFDVLLLHVFLVMRSLKDHPEATQSLFDLLFADMDRSLREMGVGDMSVGKKMKPMIMAFYGRTQAYEKALQEGSDALAIALQRNVYGAAPATADNIQRLGDYVRRATAALEKQEIDTILSGYIQFPAVIAS